MVFTTRVKDESIERDLLDERNSEQEKKLRALERKVQELKEQLEQESRERDALDKDAGEMERAKRQVLFIFFFVPIMGWALALRLTILI